MIRNDSIVLMWMNSGLIMTILLQMVIMRNRDGAMERLIECIMKRISLILDHNRGSVGIVLRILC